MILISPSVMPRASSSSTELRGTGRRRKFISFPEKLLFASRTKSWTIRASFGDSDVRGRFSLLSPAINMKSAVPRRRSSHLRKPRSTKLPPHWSPLPIVASSRVVGLKLATRYEILHLGARGQYSSRIKCIRWTLTDQRCLHPCHRQ